MPDDVSRFIDSLPIEAAATLQQPVASGYSVLDWLNVWEWCSKTLSKEGSMMVQEYINCLSCRDRIATFSASAPLTIESALRSLLDSLDRRFKQVTVDDSGAEVGAHFSIGSRSENGFWWRRRPVILPRGW